MARKDSIMAGSKVHLAVAWRNGDDIHILTGPKGTGFTTYCSRVVPAAQIAHAASDDPEDVGREWCRTCESKFGKNPGHVPAWRIHI